MKLNSFIVIITLALAGFTHAGITAGVNLLTNGSATSPVTTGWTVITGGGNGWGTGGGGYDNIGSYFITSYGLCQRSQTIDLLASGATAAELDAAPPLVVSEAISMYNGTGGNNGANDTYYIKVELRNAAGTALASWNVGTSTALKAATTSWVVESHEFRDYGPGVRFIYFEDGGRDNGGWANWYGTYHDAATVAFTNQQITDITLTPSTIPANVPAGGIAGQLRAVDPDNLTHTFTLEPEVSTSTQPLLTAGAAGWRYFDSATATPPANWTSPIFDDSTWASGPAPLGYDSTTIPTDTWQVTHISYGSNAQAKPITAWFRKTFTVNDPSVLTGLQATLMIDDGCVAYLNGQELFRDNIAVGTAVTSTTPATTGIGGTDENDYDPVVIPASKLALLVPGTNVLAIETHQDKITSSDLSLDMTLSAVSNAAVNSYSNDLFEIVGTELRVKNGSAALAPGSYTVRVKAVDSAGNSYIKLLTVQRGETFSASPPLTLQLTAVALPENAPAGTFIGTFATADLDAGDAHSYALTAGPGDDDNAKVTIADNRLFVLQPPDFEQRSALLVRVTVTDSAGSALTETFSIALTDVTSEDQDLDGLTELQEDLNNNGVLEPGETDPFLPDTDGDGYIDRIERGAGSDPRDPLSMPSVAELRQALTHATGDSWLTAASWQGSVVPTAIHRTVTDNLTFRSPPAADPVFPGAVADLRNGAIFRLKHTGLAYVSHIILNNGIIQHGMTTAISLGGGGARVEVPTTGTIEPAGAELVLEAALSGPGTVKVIGTTAGRLRLQKPAVSFTGELSLENPEVILGSPAAAGHARRIAVTAGILRTTANTALPDTVLQRSGTGKVALTNSLTAAEFVVDGTVVTAGTYTGAQLITAGIPVAAIEDNGGTITVTGALSTRDSDGDGASDLAEILAGTDPGQGSGSFRLGNFTSTGPGAFHLEWAATAGVTYTIQSATALAGPWQTLGTVTPATTAGSYDATLLAPLPEKAFFRVIRP